MSKVNIILERLKSDVISNVRQIVSKARSEFQTSLGREGNACSANGDCVNSSMHAAVELGKQYPSTKVIGGKYTGKITSKQFGKKAPGHIWVEIPEHNLYVDTTHDMFHPTLHGMPISNRGPSRPKVPTRGDQFPDNAIKIGSTKDPEYQKNYKHVVSNPWDLPDHVKASNWIKNHLPGAK